MQLKQKIELMETWLLELTLLGVCLILIKLLPAFGLHIPITFIPITMLQVLINMVFGMTLKNIQSMDLSLLLSVLKMIRLEKIEIMWRTQMVDMVYGFSISLNQEHDHVIPGFSITLILPRQDLLILAIQLFLLSSITLLLGKIKKLE
jgi:hypothetical protein